MSEKWSYTAGRRPYSVTGDERDRSPNIYYRIWMPSEGKWWRRSLGHADRAEAWADEQAAKLRRGKSDLRKDRVTLERLFRLYRKHRTPEKSEGQQMVDERQAELWKRVRSHFRELLVIANGTGRRISAICALRYDDLLLDEGPHDSIRWRADEDKQGREWIAPMNPEVRRAVDRARRRPPVGGQLFPSARNPAKPISRHFARKLLKRAEAEAKMEHRHGYRLARFPTEMGHGA